MKHTSIIATLLLLFAAMAAHAQDYTDLYITGPAVPGSAQKMVRTPDGNYQYNGALSVGTYTVQTTAAATSDTHYITPQVEDPQAANNGYEYIDTSDPKGSAFTVPIASKSYRITVFPETGVVKGEMLRPWAEMYIIGSATDGGWDGWGGLPMTQDANDPFVWTWTGELKPHAEFGTPTEFKFMGNRNNFYSKELHPYSANADILRTHVVRPYVNGAKDTKWLLRQPGRYHITIDLLHLTVKAEYLGE